MKLLLIAVTILQFITGCASIQPRTGENGEKLVFVKSITGAWIPSGVGSLGGEAVSGPIAGGNNPVAAGAAFAGIGLVIQMIKGPEVVIEIYDHDIKDPDAPTIMVGHSKVIQRKPWPGIEGLTLRSWAILAQDENGDDIVLPCYTACAPKR